MPRKITIDLPIGDLITLECLLPVLAAYADEAALEAERLNLPSTTEHIRKQAAEARRLRAVLKAATATVRYEEVA
jgi:hypothetical protein